MAGSTISVKGFLADFLTPILPKIYGELSREVLIDLHQLIIGNVASMVLNLGGGRHIHLALTMTDDEYRVQTGFAFVPPHNSGKYPQSMGSAQEQALRTKTFRQNPAPFLQIHRRGQSLEKSYCHSGGTSLPIPTGGSTHRVCMIVRTYHAATSIFQPQGDRQNRP